MRDLGKLRERDDTAGRKLGLFALSGVLSVAAIIALGVVGGGSAEREQTPQRDPLEELALSAGDPKAPVRSAVVAPKASVELERLSFPATLVGDDAVIQATIRAAEAELATLSTRSPRARPNEETLRASDIPAGSLAGEQSLRLRRSARHDPLMAQALPERTEGSYAPHGSDGAFTLQVVSFEQRDPAERFAHALRARSHKAYIVAAEVPGRGRTFRVRVGPFATRREAIDYQTRFEQTEHMHTILVSGAGK